MGGKNNIFTPKERKRIAKELGFLVRDNAFIVGSGPISDHKFMVMMLLILEEGAFYTGAELGAWKEWRSRSIPIKKKIRAVLGNILKNISDKISTSTKITNGDIYYLTRRIWTTLLDNKVVKDQKYKVVKKRGELFLVEA